MGKNPTFLTPRPRKIQLRVSARGFAQTRANVKIRGLFGGDELADRANLASRTAARTQKIAIDAQLPILARLHVEAQIEIACIAGLVQQRSDHSLVGHVQHEIPRRDRLHR
mgnify:CR=1 FL=1